MREEAARPRTRVYRPMAEQQGQSAGWRRSAPHSREQAMRAPVTERAAADAGLQVAGPHVLARRAFAAPAVGAGRGQRIAVGAGRGQRTAQTREQRSGADDPRDGARGTRHSSYSASACRSAAQLLPLLLRQALISIQVLQPFDRSILKPQWRERQKDASSRQFEYSFLLSPDLVPPSPAPVLTRLKVSLLRRARGMAQHQSFGQSAVPCPSSAPPRSAPQLG